MKSYNVKVCYTYNEEGDYTSYDNVTSNQVEIIIKQMKDCPPNEFVNFKVGNKRIIMRKNYIDEIIIEDFEED